jgi:hypothetical protein
LMSESGTRSASRAATHHHASPRVAMFQAVSR